MLELDISEKHKFMQQLNRWNFYYKKRDADTFQAAFRTPVRNLTDLLLHRSSNSLTSTQG